MAQKNQGGSVLGFVVVAIVMAGLLIGGAYAVRQLTSQPQQASSEPPAQSQDQTTQQDAKKDTAGRENADKKTPASSNESAATDGTAQLPKTGAEGLLGPAIALGMLSGAIVSYVRSRRPELSF